MNNQTNVKRGQIITVFLFLFALALFMLLISTVINSNPQEIGPAGVTFWFIGILVMVSSLISGISMLIMSRNKNSRYNLKKNLLHSLRTGFLLGFTTSVLLALSSLRSLTWRDIILFILTALLVEFYFRTRQVG